MKLKKGSTRWVFVVNNWAIKIPSCYNYESFLKGLLSNMQEVKFSKCIQMKERLCPIAFYLPLGLLVVMPRAIGFKKEHMSIESLEYFRNNNGYPIPVELKPDSFGYYEGRLVALDYG